jgi:DNA-binding phage protein
LTGLTSLDEFLDQEGIRAEVDVGAVKRLVAMQLQRAMRRRAMTKAQLARRMRTSRAQIDRILDPRRGNVTLDTLARAAKIVGRSLRVALV